MGRKAPLLSQMPQLILGGDECIIKQYHCAGEYESKTDILSTGVTITSKRLIKTQEYKDGNKFRSFAVEQIYLKDVSGVSHGKSVGIRKNVALLVFGIILCPVLIGIFMLAAYCKRADDVARWLTVYAKTEKAVFSFGKQEIYKRTDNSVSDNMVVINFYDGIEKLGDELMPIIFDVQELGPEAAADKWNANKIFSEKVLDKVAVH